MRQRYLKIVDFGVQAGLLHSLSNLTTFIRKAYYMDRVLIMPTFHLAAHHNQGRLVSTDFSQYIQLENLRVNHEPCRLSLTHPAGADPRDIAVLSMFERDLARLHPDIVGEVPGYPLEISFVPAIVEAGERISRCIGGPYACVHVRRNDMGRAWGDEARHDRYTSPDNIMAAIKRCGQPHVYIMSDESPDYFRALKTMPGYKIWLYDDFAELCRIKKRDNYHLFCIENVIMQLAKKRVGTKAGYLGGGGYLFLRQGAQKACCYDDFLYPP